jgi:CubicO group peptidase (beta-lactamase class C family)
LLNGKQIVSEAWIEESWQAHATIDDEQTFGYLWWRRTFDVNERQFQSYFAAGNGGQTIWVFPDLDMVVVMTSTAYGTRYGNRQPVQILQDYILPATT